MKSFKPMFKVSGEWYGNAQAFATEGEAECSARARFSVWTTPSDYRVDASEEPVNYARIDGQDRPVDHE